MRAAASLLVAVLLGAAVAHAKRGGVLEPVPAPAHMRFVQHQQQQRVGSEAPDWWHYVAPWWSPPEHDATKAPPDFVTETAAFKHYAEPPANTMPVYVPYGRDAMSSFVETGTRVRAYGPQTAALARQRMAAEQAFMPPQPSPQALMAQYAAASAPAQRPLYAGVDTGFGPTPTAGMRYPMPHFEQQMEQMQTHAAGAQTQTQSQSQSAAAAAGAPPTMPSFPAVPQLDAAGNEFSLPSILQLNSPYEAMLQRALHPERAQAQQMGQQYGAPAQGPADAMRFEADAKQSEAMEDARWAKMADEEFGAHARAARAGGQVPRIWRTDRQSDSDMAEERDFEAAAPSDAEAEADAQDAQEAHALDADADAYDGAAAAADMQFRERTDVAARRRGGVHSAAMSDAEAAADAEADAADEQALAAAERRDESAYAAAQKLRAASAAQFDEEQSGAAEEAQAEAAPEAAGAVDVSAPFSAYRFQQIGDGEEESSDSDAEADAELDAELDEEEEREADARQTAADAGAAEETEESEADADAAADVDALLEREADAMAAASDRRIRL